MVQKIIQNLLAIDVSSGVRIGCLIVNFQNFQSHISCHQLAIAEWLVVNRLMQTCRFYYTLCTDLQSIGELVTISNIGTNKLVRLALLTDSKSCIVVFTPRVLG